MDEGSESIAWVVVRDTLAGLAAVAAVVSISFGIALGLVWLATAVLS